MTYATTETSEAAGQPVELYRFHVGSSFVPGRRVAADGLEYASQAAAIAAGWTFTGVWVIPETNHVTQGSRSWSTGLGTATRVFGVADGLAALTSYTVRVWATMNQKDWYDSSTYLTVNGVTGADANMDGSGVFPEDVMVLTTTSNSAGELSVTLTRESFAGRTTWFDDLVILLPSAPAVTETVYGFTSADVDQSFQGTDYVASILTRSPMRAGGNESGSYNLELTIPRDHALVTLCQGPPRLPVGLTVYRVHRDDVAAGTSYATPWQGQVVGLRVRGAEAVLVCAPINALLERRVPRYLTQRTCGHMLYDSLCQADRASFTSASLAVSAISGRTVTVDGSAAAAGTDDTHWRDGLVLAPDGTIGSVEAFSAAVGDVLTLKQALPGLTVGDSVTLVAGCDKRVGTCLTRFNNVVHFGGEPVMPIRNPGTGAGLGVSDGSAA